MATRTADGRIPTAGELITEKLRHDILTGKLEPGEKLPLDVLAGRFGTSVIPIRESLRVLEAERLVELRAHRTATVAALSLEAVQDLYRVRLILETEAVRMAHGNLPAAKLAEIRTLIDRMERAAERRDSLRSFTLHNQIHFTIYEAAGSPALVKILTGLWDETERYRHAVKHFRSDTRTWAEEHRHLADLLERGTAEDAAAEIKAHLTKTVQALTMARDSTDDQASPNRRTGVSASS